MSTIDDLRRELAEEAANLPETTDRLAGVHHRIATRRRQRAAGASLAVVALVAFSAVALPHLARDAGRTPPSDSSPSVPGDVPLPEYHLGGVLVSQQTQTGSEPFWVRFTAGNRSLMFTVDCSAPTASDPETLMVSLSINGGDPFRTSCSGDPYLTGANTYTTEPGLLRLVTPGQPGVVSVSFDGPAPSDTRVRVGIYQAVPLAEYPFPPQPDPLPTLEPSGNLDRSTHQNPVLRVTPDVGLPVDELDTTYVEPNGTSTHQLTLEHGLTIDGQTVAPGALAVKVDGRTVFTTASWDYDPNGFGAHLSLRDLGIDAGEQVEVTVVAERFVGESWAILLSDETAPTG